MTVVDTYTLLPTNLTNSNVAYPTAGIDNTALYAAGTTYALDALVYYNNKNYKSLQASNLGKTPDLNPTWWLDQGYCNRFKAIDSIISSQTSNTNTITFDLSTNISDVGYIGFFNIDAYSITITQTDVDTNTVVLTDTVYLKEETETSWYDYWFSVPVFSDTKVLTLAPYKNVKITITVEKTGSTAKLGTVAFGGSSYIGVTLYGASIGMVDYSKKEINEFGDVYLKQGKYSDTTNFEIFHPSASTTAVHQKLRARRAIASIWIMDETEKYKSTSIYGYYKDFQILIDNGVITKSQLQLESLT